MNKDYFQTKRTLNNGLSYTKGSPSFNSFSKNNTL